MLPFREPGRPQGAATPEGSGRRWEKEFPCVPGRAVSFPEGGSCPPSSHSSGGFCFAPGVSGSHPHTVLCAVRVVPVLSRGAPRWAQSSGGCSGDSRAVASSPWLPGAAGSCTRGVHSRCARTVSRRSPLPGTAVQPVVLPPERLARTLQRSPVLPQGDALLALYFLVSTLWTCNSHTRQLTHQERAMPWF